MAGDIGEEARDERFGAVPISGDFVLYLAGKALGQKEASAGQAAIVALRGNDSAGAGFPLDP